MQIHKMVLGLEPLGCGSRTLSECLLAQANVFPDQVSFFEKLITDCLNDVKNEQYQKIAQRLDMPLDFIKDACQRLRGLHPKPGRLVVNQYINYIIPDVYVTKVGEDFVVKVNEEGVPRLRISKLYQDMLNTVADGDEAAEYVREKLRSAMHFIKAIRNRRKTIYRVTEAILLRQQDFFKSGPRHLRPMVLQDIAHEIGVHTSTVSRVTANKYMHTPIGVFELKYFFNSSVGEGGMQVTAEVIKGHIKDMIELENSKRPLTDGKISSLLAQDGFNVARRTVAKYREELDIPAFSIRRTAGCK